METTKSIYGAALGIKPQWSQSPIFHWTDIGMLALTAGDLPMMSRASRDKEQLAGLRSQMGVSIVMGVP